MSFFSFLTGSLLVIINSDKYFISLFEDATKIAKQTLAAFNAVTNLTNFQKLKKISNRSKFILQICIQTKFFTRLSYDSNTSLTTNHSYAQTKQFIMQLILRGD